MSALLQPASELELKLCSNEPALRHADRARAAKAALCVSTTTYLSVNDLAKKKSSAKYCPNVLMPPTSSSTFFLISADIPVGQLMPTRSADKYMRACAVPKYTCNSLRVRCWFHTRREKMGEDKRER